MRGQFDNLPPAGRSYGVREHEEAFDSLGGHRLEGRTNVIWRVLNHRQNLKALFRGGFLKIDHRLRMESVVGIEQNREP